MGVFCRTGHAIAQGTTERWAWIFPEIDVVRLRGDLTDAEWAIIGDILPPERGRWSRPAHDNRLFLNGMLYVLRVGCPWRDMHERYGKWNSVYVRFRRWAEQGVWDALLDTLVDLGLTDDWQHMMDSTAVRANSQAAGAKGDI